MTIPQIIAEIFDAVTKFRSGDLTLYQALTVAIDVLQFCRDVMTPVIGDETPLVPQSEVELLNLEEAVAHAVTDMNLALSQSATDVAAGTESPLVGSIPWAVILQAALQILLEYLRNRPKNP